MKKVSSLLLGIGVIAFLAASCSPFPRSKRKNCNGKGGWYGNRNLGAADHVQKNKIVNQKAYRVTKEDLVTE